MINGDLRFEGFDAGSWTNLIALFSPSVMDRMSATPNVSDDPETQATESAARAGTLTLVEDSSGHLLKAFHSVRGRVTDLEYDPGLPLEELANRYAARRVVRLKEGVMEEIGERIALRLHRKDDYVAEWLAVARILREVIDGGQLEIWPRPLANVPIPSPTTVGRALDVVLPDDRALLTILWERQNIWTAFALQKKAGMINRVVGPDLIFRWTGPLGGDWRRDHRVVARAIAREMAPVHVGVFAEARTMISLLRKGDRGSWARAVAVRDVIVHPTPPYVAVALGADAVRGVARKTAEYLGGLDAFEMVAPLLGSLRSRIGEVSSVTQTLGFNPLSALSAVLGTRGDEPEEFPERAPTSPQSPAAELPDAESRT